MQKVKHPLSIMIWGSISAHGVDRMHIVEETMNQDLYQKVLEKQLLPLIPAWRGSRDADVAFQQDSAPCHTARKMRRFHRRHGLQLLDWPGRAPTRIRIRLKMLGRQNE